MKKKVTISLIVLFLFLAGTGIFAFANNKNATVYTIHENGVICSLKTYNSTASGEVIIPKEYDGVMVTEISPNAFLKCTDVTSVVVPKTVIKIGEYSLGYTTNRKGHKIKNDEFVILGRAGSAAEKYATENGFMFKVHLTTPEITEVKNIPSGIEINWNPTENSAGYDIFRKEPDGEWQKIDYVDGEDARLYLDKKVKNGNEYIYSVNARNGNFSSEHNRREAQILFISAPDVECLNKQNGVLVNWTKNEKATSYKIFKKLFNDTTWQQIGESNTDTLSFLDENTTSGEKANYCVLAYKDEFESGYNSSNTNIYLNEPSVSSVENLLNGIKISWNDIAGANNYSVYRKTGSSKWEKIADIPQGTLSYLDESVYVGFEYTYTVRALSEESISSHDSGKKTLHIKSPAAIDLTLTSNGLIVSWDSVQMAETYSVYRKDATGNWIEIFATKDNQTLNYVDNTVTVGNVYDYAVVSKLKDATSSIDSSNIKFTYFSAPKLTAVKCIKSEEIILEWTKVDGTGAYNIYKKEIGGEYNMIATAGADDTSYSDKDIAIGKEYSYLVKATSVSGIESGSSNEKSARVLDPNRPMVALTYDDGPSGSATTRILNVLERYNARATFFVVGSRVDDYKYQIKRAYDLNCEIANHTYNHTTLTSISAAEIKNELNSTNDKVEAITGERPILMRPPGGSYKTDTVKANTGAPIIMWSVDTLDWKNRDATIVSNNIKSSVYNGSIVLMHDLYDSTAAATEEIVPWLINQGYQIVTVSELMNTKGITMENGVAYNSAR